MNNPSVGELERACKRGERFRLHASAYERYDFQKICKACAQGGGMVTIYEASLLSDSVRRTIGMYGGVTFEL